MFQFKKVLCMSVLVFVINQSSATPVASKAPEESVDLNVDLSCVTNSSCIVNVSNRIVRALKTKQMIDFGAFSIEPVKNANKVEGRSTSKLSDIAAGNALRVPFGAYSLALQKSQEYDNYLEVSISKTIEGRGRHERKQMQFFVPAFLVASQVGWWMLALAGVTLLAIKAFLVSKLALAFGVIMTLKKLFEHHGGIHTPFYEHHEPLMVPYNFDLGGYSGPSGFPGDFHPSLPLGHEQTAALHQNGALGAETTNVVTNITGGSTSVVNSPGLSAYATVARHPPLNFNFLGKNPFLYRKP